MTTFRKWMGHVPIEATTANLLADLEVLAKFYVDSLEPMPDFPRLWKLAHPPTLACMRRETFDLIAPQRKNAWQKVAGNEAGTRLSNEAEDLFARVNTCYQTLLGRIATALVEILSNEMDEVLNDYAAFKRAAAVLDFDDLLHRARALVQGHEDVRRALGERYRHILVDEFQDTDPIQAEILFRIASSEVAAQWQQSALRPGALFMVGDPKQAIYRFRGADVGSYAQARNAIQRQWPDNLIQITANFRSVPGILDYVNGHFGAALAARGQPGYVALTPIRPVAEHGLPCVAKRTIELPPSCKAHEIRDAEASEAAELCERLVGNLKIRDDTGNWSRWVRAALHSSRRRVHNFGVTSGRSRHAACRLHPAQERVCFAARKSRTCWQ